MTDRDPTAARARGQAMRNARLARARTIRRRIIAGALALFVASWLLITVVLVSGHDPALAKNSSATTTSSTPSTSTTSSGTSSSTNSSSGTSSSNTSSSQNTGSSGTTSSVTTSQS